MRRPTAGLPRRPFHSFGPAVCAHTPRGPTLQPISSAHRPTSSRRKPRADSACINSSPCVCNLTSTDRAHRIRESKIQVPLHMEERDIVLSYNDNRMVSGESGLSHRRSSSTRPSMSAGHDRVSSGSGPSSGIARAGARRLSVLAPPATIFRKQSKSQASPTIAHKREPSDVLRKLLP